MALNVNQFAMSTVQGQMDMNAPGLVISGEVDAAVVTPLIAGQAVKMATTAGGVPKFLPLAANTDIPFGFVARNIKDANFAPASYNSFFECAIAGAIMYMTAGAAITRGARVEVSNAAFKIITSAGVNPVCGIALDAATADGDLIRVRIATPSINPSAAAVQSAIVTATLAEINAGKVLIPGQTGQKITLLHYTARVTGAFATGTAVILESTNVSPVVASTIAEAALTNGAVLTESSANTTLGAGFATQLGTGDGLQVVNSGSAQTGGTNIQFTLTYQQA